MPLKTTGFSLAPIRADLLPAAMLALITILLWCAHYNRWTSEGWAVPLSYLGEPDKSDVLNHLAWIEAARDGHISPFFYNNVPELGAPSVANWNDFPLPEKPLYMLTGLLARFIGLFAAANAAVLLAQAFAALAFYAAARLLGASWVWGVAGGLVFAFPRYAFSHGLHHLNVVCYWHVPLDLLVVEWLLRGEGVGWRDWRLAFALAVAVVTAAQSIYYTYLFGQFVVLACVYQAWRGGWRRALPSAAVVVAMVATFGLMNLPTIIYRLANGPGGAVVRMYQWLEVYGLKLVDLVIPPPDHPFPPFAEWGRGHLTEVVLSPGELPPTGYIGLVGIAALTWLVVVSLRRVAERLPLPLEALMVLWIIVFAGVGGINGVIGTLGFDLIRSTTRYSIVVLAIVLLFAVRWLSALKVPREAKWLPLVAVVLGVALALWDQMPPMVTDQEVAELATQVQADRKFTEAMESRLPAGAMVYQLPAMDFPESPAPGVLPYDHLRPYLFAKQLRFSFGTDKGRPDGEWQKETGQLPPGLMVDELLGKGFGAIYVNRGGYADHGAALLGALAARGEGDVIEDERGDLFCVILKR